MSRLVSYFLRGVVFVVPIGLTVWVLVGAFQGADHWARERFYLPFPGLGFAALVVAITLVGFLASNFLTRSLMRAVERLFDRLPVIKMLHGAVKDLLSAFVGDKRKFDQPVIVSLSPDNRIKVMGFLTRDNLGDYNQPTHVAVYFPQAYNFAGQVLMVPRDAVTPVDVPASEVMAFIVSGGISGK